jgi:hypothetical protein
MLARLRWSGEVRPTSYGEVAPWRRGARDGAGADNLGCLMSNYGKICPPAGLFDPTRWSAVQAVLNDKNSQVQHEPTTFSDEHGGDGG